MEEKMIAVAALLGITSEKASVDSVSASIKALQDKAKEFDTLKASYDKLKQEHSNMETEFAASKASVQNLTADLQKANDDLKKYQDAEKAAFDAKVETLVEAAIQACKINKDDKESWVEMAKNNFDLTKKALDSIPAREDLGKKAGTAEAPKASEEMKSEEEKLKAKVDEVVGDKFEFRKMD
jgi:predicted  nucleic acid-binding Zn-ribbon protein